LSAIAEVVSPPAGTEAATGLPSFSIRPLKPEDRQPIHDLLVDTAVFTDDEIAIAMELVDCVLRDPHQKDYVIATAVERASVVGYYCIGPTPATDGTFDLYWIAASPRVHGKGVGPMLDGHAAAFARARGGRLMIAETSSLPRYEKTRRFYVRRGYTETARIRDYYRPGDDLLVYCKILTSTPGG